MIGTYRLRINLLRSCIFCWLCLASGGLHAAELRMVLFDIAPYASQPAGSQPAGIYVDIAQRIGKKMGLNVRFEIVPFARVSFMLGQGQADATISFSTASLEHDALPLMPVRRVNSVVLLHRGHAVSKVAELSGLQIGRLRGGCQDLFAKDDGALKPYDVNSLNSGLRMLAARRIDGLCATQDALDHYMIQEKLSYRHFGPAVVVSQREAWLHVRKDLPVETQQALRRAVEELRRESGL